MAKRISIFDSEPKRDGEGGNAFANSVVGRFHGGYVLNRKPKSLDEWRVTSDDPNVVRDIAELFGGEPQQIDGDKAPVHEVFTKAASVDIIIENADAISSEFVQWGNDGKPVRRSDGETITWSDIDSDEIGEPDPGSHLALPERKEKAKKGLVPAPQTELYFRLADAPELGIFKFVQRAAWSLERDLAVTSFYDKLEAASEDGEEVLAELKRQPESFVAKNGDMAGKTVTFTATKLIYKGINISE